MSEDPHRENLCKELTVRNPERNCERKPLACFGQVVLCCQYDHLGRQTDIIIGGRQKIMRPLRNHRRDIFLHPSRHYDVPLKVGRSTRKRGLSLTLFSVKLVFFFVFSLCRLPQDTEIARLYFVLLQRKWFLD